MKLNLTLPKFLRIGTLPLVLIVLAAIAAVVAMARYAYGIGAISDLSYSYPWGFWISFDLFTGVVISSGGFLMAGTVYILRIKEFQPLLRPAVLTALLGYIMVAVALLVDLGQPLRIWYMMIYWNHTSVLLEIGICVMSYLTVLAIEFAPVVMERFPKLHKAAHFIHKFIMPFVILGVVLSTLHQSSLGSLLLIQPQKLHPLWWTPILPILFFTSAIAVGLAMIILESSLSSRYFQRGLETHLLAKLAKAIPVVLVVYALIKFGDLIVAGDLGYLFTSGWMSVLFWAEILIGVVFPIVWFSIPKNRSNPNLLLTGAIVTLLGLILNRFNVSWFAVKHPDPLFYLPTFMGNVKYFPTLPEVAVSIGIFSAGILAFGLIAKYFPVFEDEGRAAHAGD
ncbi:MAG: formate dehydrogenase [Anaerolineaceae bacterium]|nr:Ni/Fe-hydrogenase cytochrome b subunit [Anaerolineae bacterium]MDL1925464.1 Ni/Fe-hydrogenase cytochrome b subunit [Anaerolineae bacterium AMX1]WKZ54676.1 MAG: Ni/Fe-hydrogenase cytochrome b subunit [Anaerolineales bacterium]GIK08757.1 MAG: formate dehydrogenase [Chloroflexota bacterium]GJQ38530.1 MAG: formate dehydrogenase [Anaerolineaceae bacterium]